MPNIIGVGQVSLTDLNDAIVAGEPPSNPSVNTLWIDETESPPMLKRWSGQAWINLGELDPDTSVIIESISRTLGNMANDNLIDFKERQIIKDRLSDMIGFVMSDDTSTLPSVKELDISRKGSFWSIRNSAINVGIEESNRAYRYFAASYEELKRYLEGLTPISVWDTRNRNSDITIEVRKEEFRNKWLQYYYSADALSTEISEKIRKNEEELKKDVEEAQREVEYALVRVTNVEHRITDESIINKITSSNKWVEQGEAIRRAQETADGKVSADYVDGQVEGLEIGGRNLVLESDQEVYFAEQGDIFTRVQDYNKIYDENKVFGLIIPTWEDIGDKTWREWVKE